MTSRYLKEQISALTVQMMLMFEDHQLIWAQLCTTLYFYNTSTYTCIYFGTKSILQIQLSVTIIKPVQCRFVIVMHKD